MIGLGVLFLIALGLIAAKGGGGSTPLGVPGLEGMPLELRQRIAECLKALTVQEDGKIAGPVSAEAIRTATALAGELDRLGWKDAAAGIRAYAKAAASMLPPTDPKKKIPLPPGIPPELQEKLQRALQMERDPKVLEGIKAALQGLPPSPETKHAIELLDQMILQLKIAAENQRAATDIHKVITGDDKLSLPAPPTPAPPVSIVPPSPEVARYKVVRGDTGEKIAFKFVGDKNRWRELLSTNPKFADAKYGIRLYEGQTIIIPTAKGWPAVPGQIAPPSPLPSAPPSVIPSVTPSAPMTPVEAAADAMVKNLQAVQRNFGVPGAKGKEDKSLVMRFQSLSGQSTPDGKAGPGTLASAAMAGQSDMPLVMYWPKSATASKVLEYRTVLNGLAGKADTVGDTIRAANLRASALREHGQAGIVGPMPS